MTPNFALSLSFEGIRLLHRTSGGWHLVGEVSPDAPDLAAQMAVLRKTAALLEPARLRTKLVLPSEQVKFLTIDTAQTSDADILQALDGTTPYALDELKIDFDRAGGRTHVAAVAKETLAEAEAFAAEHKFNPVAFVAEAQPFTFRQEVFFGPTALAATLLAPGEEIARDAEAIRIVGQAHLPQPGAPETTPVLAPEDAPEGVAVALSSFADEAPAPPPAKAVAAPVAETAPAVAPAVAPVKERAPATVAESASSDVVFTSRARPKSLPPQPMPAPARPSAAPAKAKDQTDEPLFTRRRDPPPLAVPTGQVDGPPVAAAPGGTIPPVRKPVTADAPEPHAAPALTGKASNVLTVPPTAAPAAVPAEVRPARPAPVAEPKPNPAKASDGFVPLATPARGKPRFLLLKLVAALIVFLVLVALWAGTLSENGLAGWFGGEEAVPLADETLTVDPVEAASLPAPAPAPVTETPAAPAEEVAAAPEELAPEQPALAEVLPETPAPSALAPVPDEVVAAPEEATPPLPIVRAPSNRILTPAEAERIYAATGVWQRAPRFPVDPRTTSLEGFVGYDPLPEANRPTPARLPADGAEAVLSDLPIPAQLDPPPPGTRFQRDLRGFILAMPDGIVTPDGALVIAGEPPLLPPARPGTEAPEVVAVAPEAAAGDPEAAPDLILIAGPPPRVPPLRPEGLAPEPPQEDAALAPPADPVVGPEAAPQETVDATALAVAAALAGSAAAETPTEEASEAPPVEAADVSTRSAPTDVAPVTGDANLVLSFGPPPVQPPLRPAGLAPAAEPQVAVAPVEIIAPGGVALASFRPAERPVGVAPDLPVIASDPALEGFRPNLRPAGLAPAPAPEEPARPDINAVVAALAEAAPPSNFQNVTGRAVPVSARPDTRPRNFARVVAAAQARVARQQAPAAPATSSAPTQTVSAQPARPTGPVPGSVAQAATISNAIGLRDINLIGVYGRPNDRRALVRLGNGQFVKVEIGSALDGGRVSAIGDNALNYIKRGRTYALQIGG